jgi:hypothetical protein
MPLSKHAVRGDCSFKTRPLVGNVTAYGGESAADIQRGAPLVPMMSRVNDGTRKFSCGTVERKAQSPRGLQQMISRFGHQSVPSQLLTHGSTYALPVFTLYGGDPDRQTSRE